MQSFKASFKFRLTMVALLFPSVAVAIGPRHQNSVFKSPNETSKKKTIWHSPFQKSAQPSLLERKSFGLLQSGQIDLDAVVSTFVNQRSSWPGLKLSPEFRTGFSLTGNSEHKRYGLSFQGIPLCRGEVKATQFEDEPVITGSIPEVIQGQSIDSSDWPSLFSARQAAAQQLKSMQMSGATYTPKSGKRCIFVEQGEMIPVWKMTFNHEGLPYQIWSGQHDSYHWQAGYFQATGAGRAYAKNPNFPSAGSPTIDDYVINDLTGDGYLTTDIMTTDPVGVDRVQNGPLQFLKNPGEEGFAEINTFVHADKTLSWFEENGFSYGDEDRTTIQVHYIFSGGDINNAVYQPLPTGPTIRIADGGMENGQVRLENLALDGDVVSHEFAHHVIFQSIKDTSPGSESLVLHEGLADAFTFLRTDDACLGESICPANSTFPCFEKGACLRSADNNFKFTDPDLDPGHHARGQFISGMIWDLKKSGKIPREHLSEILVKAIDLMISDSGYLHLILAMMTMDRQLFNGDYGCDIYDAAGFRGLGAAIEDFTCEDDSLPAIDASTQEPIGVDGIDRSSGSISSAGSGDSGKEKSFCGTLGSERSSNKWLWLILLAPLVVVREKFQV